MKEFELQIVTPDGLIFDGNAERLTVRADDGDVEILAGHVDYVASLGTGTARLVSDGKERAAAASGGFITVSGGKVKLVAVTFEFAEEIDVERARRARERALEMRREAKTEREIALAEARLKRAMSRISAAGK